MIDVDLRRHHRGITGRFRGDVRRNCMKRFRGNAEIALAGLHGDGVKNLCRTGDAAE